MGGGESIWHALCFFSKNVFFKEGESIWLPLWFFSQKCVFQRKVEVWFLVTFNIIMCHIVPENFIEIPQVVQKLLKFSSSTLTIFTSFSDFLAFSCYKEANDLSM